jgi:low temperature requirement protein LtrA
VIHSKQPSWNCFDLAFVFALAQLSYGLIRNLSWSGGFQTLVLLLASWWIWYTNASVTDRFGPQRPAIPALSSQACTSPSRSAAPST